MEIQKSVAGALSMLEACGHEAFIVGGSVRDLLMGRAPGDWDICTSARPLQVAECFREYPTHPTGLRHGTLTVLLEGTPLEITTYRADGPYENNRRPREVTFVSNLRKDLARRDFTVNAMAYSPAAGLVDPFGGAEDLKAGILRSVGEPEARFSEDGLRIMRALRFASRLGFAIDPALDKALHSQRHLLGNISAERQNAELCGLLDGGGAGKVLAEYPDVLEAFIPELGSVIKEGRWPWVAGRVAAVPGDRILRLALLLGELGEKSARIILSRLRFDNATQEAVGGLVRRQHTPLGQAGVLQWLNRLGAEQLGRLLLVKKALGLETPGDLDAFEKRMQTALTEGQCYRLEDLAVDGNDVIRAGIRQGKEVGRTLCTLLERVMDGGLPNERDALLAALKRRE